MERTLTENDVMVIKSLNADLRAVSASLAAAQERIRALEAENERLRDTVKAIVSVIDADLTEGETSPSLIITRLLDDEIQIKRLIFEALQAKEAE